MGGEMTNVMGRACSLVCAVNMGQVNRTQGPFNVLGRDSDRANLIMGKTWLETVRASDRWVFTNGTGNVVLF